MPGSINKKRLALVSLATLTITLILYTLIEVYFIQRSYSIQASKKVKNSPILDNLSIPFDNYGYVNGVYVGIQRNPLSISETALEYYERINKGDEKFRQPFFNCTDWLVKHSVKHKSYSILEYKFPWPLLYNITPPWHSAMGQAGALQALAKAYKLGFDKKYLEASRSILNSFFIEVKDGGVTYKTLKEGWWYEEYAKAGQKEPRVLNGMIYAVLKIYDYYQLTGDSNAKYLFDQGILALKKNISRYDGKGHSYYDSLGNYSRKYHKIHIQMLGDLYAVTHETAFDQYRTKWENYKF